METRKQGAVFARSPEGATPPKTSKLSTAKKPSRTLRRQSSAFRRSEGLTPPTERGIIELGDRDDENRVDYDHPFPSMAAFADALAPAYAIRGPPVAPPPHHNLALSQVRRDDRK